MDMFYQICAFGQWQTLCGNAWTLTQRREGACRQLGSNPVDKSTDIDCTSRTTSLTNTISWVSDLFMDILNCTLIMLIMLALLVTTKGKS